jgi:hypothetical protein
VARVRGARVVQVTVDACQISKTHKNKS